MADTLWKARECEEILTHQIDALEAALCALMAGDDEGDHQVGMELDRVARRKRMERMSVRGLVGDLLSDLAREHKALAEQELEASEGLLEELYG